MEYERIASFPQPPKDEVYLHSMECTIHPGLAMKVEELDMDDELRSILKESGISELYPTQVESIPAVLAGESVVVSVPTASGKSLIGYAALLRAFRQGNKGLYVAPLRALAAEKYRELSVFHKAGMKIALATGDFDTPGDTLAKRDVIFATSEKADSLLRHNSAWIREISTLVVDEIHLIGDESRGPTLEMVISRLRKMNPGIQIVGLSATIKNSLEIAEWLGAKHIYSEWRPVPLRQGVYSEGSLVFSDGSIEEIGFKDDELWGLIERSVTSGGQVLVFVNTRKNAENAAMKYAERMRRLCEGAEAIAEDMEEANELTRKINACLKSGLAFHHAGLTANQRTQIEERFIKGQVKCLFATPTLAAGINLPARTVIVRDVHRYDGPSGAHLIPVMEIKQMCGRAGRPKYDREGEAIIFARNRETARMLFEEYVLGEPESIFSQMGTEMAIRSHVLSAIASRICGNREELSELFSTTFFAAQNSGGYIEAPLDLALNYLIREGMVVDEGGRFRATLFGRRVSDLYLDPASAVILRTALSLYAPGKELGLLHAISATPDILPAYVSQSELEEYFEIAASRKDELILEMGDEPEQYMAQLKTAMILNDWISEEEEDTILKRYGIYPGDLREKCENARWLMAACHELAALQNSEFATEIGVLSKRMEKGVSERLLDLATLKGIGRRRAKLLFLHGYRNRSQLKGASLEELVKVPGIGKELAISILKQCGRAVADRDEGRKNGNNWFFT